MKVEMNESEFFNYSCTVKSFTKVDGKWIEYRSFAWNNRLFTPLN